MPKPENDAVQRGIEPTRLGIMQMGLHGGHEIRRAFRKYGERLEDGGPGRVVN